MLNTLYEWEYGNPFPSQDYDLLDTVKAGGAPIIKLYCQKIKSDLIPPPLNPAGWEAQSNFGFERLPWALDGNLITHWSSLQAQDPGMYFQIDMKQIHTIRGIGLVFWTSAKAYPVGYIVEVSENGENWISVASNPQTPPTDIVLDIFFSPIPARFIKITQTGYSPTSGWAIHEFYVYPAI